MATVVPNIVEKQRGTVLNRVDGVLYMSTSASTVWSYLAAAAVLYNSAEEAIQDMVCAEQRAALWDAAQRSGDTRIGARELKQVLAEVISVGHAAYGIRCEPRNASAVPRERGYFDEDQLLVLNLEKIDTNVVATVVGAALASDVAAGLRVRMTPFESAIDDLDIPPRGNVAPEKSATRSGTGYRRDDAVRDYVILRSRGYCEYCGVLGFETEKGHFVEAHHIIALSAQGPDTVDNVIALCPGHHREAHYGTQAELLEKAFLAKLQELAK